MSGVNVLPQTTMLHALLILTAAWLPAADLSAATQATDSSTQERAWATGSEAPCAQLQLHVPGTPPPAPKGNGDTPPVIKETPLPPV